MTTIVQLQDEHTGNDIAPITHWDAISNKPDVATKSDVNSLLPLILAAL